MDDMALTIIGEHAKTGANLRTLFFEQYADLLKQAAQEMAKRFIEGNKLILCGNGGSAADCQHLAAEFVNRFLQERSALPALALTTDSSILTAVANDYDYTKVFSRQVEALGRKGDFLIAISTSGTSKNVVQAAKMARANGLITMALTGEGGGALRDCDYVFAVPSISTPLIQEIHLACEHLFCQLVDYYLFENVAALDLSSVS
ncbi:MAG: D-sedoheptulose 7-phosphate isomerase [Desulfovibrio sp.]|nr:D-sedoheptulose 7-phosphate isomerase [Desulfovibrio sp.]